MSNDCLDAGALDRLVDDPSARRHAEDCPCCYELLASYRQFVEARAVPNARADSAELELHKVLDDLPRRSLPQTRRGFRPMAWIAAAAAAAAVFFLWPRAAEIPERPVLREEAASSFGLLSPNVGESGWFLRWSELETAESYEVRLYSTSLEEIQRIGPLSEPFTTLEFPEAEGVTWLWRVVALRNGDVVDETDVGTLTR